MGIFDLFDDVKRSVSFAIDDASRNAKKTINAAYKDVNEAVNSDGCMRDREKREEISEFAEESLNAVLSKNHDILIDGSLREIKGYDGIGEALSWYSERGGDRRLSLRENLDRRGCKISFYFDVFFYGYSSELVRDQKIEALEAKIQKLEQLSKKIETHGDPLASSTGGLFGNFGWNLR